MIFATVNPWPVRIPFHQTMSQEKVDIGQRTSLQLMRTHTPIQIDMSLYVPQKGPDRSSRPLQAMPICFCIALSFPFRILCKAAPMSKHQCVSQTNNNDNNLKTLMCACVNPWPVLHFSKRWQKQPVGGQKRASGCERFQEKMSVLPERIYWFIPQNTFKNPWEFELHFWWCPVIYREFALENTCAIFSSSHIAMRIFKERPVTSK